MATKTITVRADESKFAEWTKAAAIKGKPRNTIIVEAVDKDIKRILRHKGE